MVIISGVGWSCADNLYRNIDYNSEGFKSCMSKRRGDGGISPGHLSFQESWKQFTGKPIEQIRKDMGWDREPDKYSVGGPCIVGMINASQLLAGENVQVRCFGAIGDDDTGKRMLETLKKTRMDLKYLQRVPGGVSPATVCLSDPNYHNGHGERSFGVELGLYGTMAAEDLVTDEFFEGDVHYYSSTALTPTIHSKLTTLLKRSKDMGKLTVVGTVFDHISETKFPGQRWKMGESDDSFKYMDLLMVDFEEALSISGKKTIEKAIQFFIHHGVKALTVTHGPEPLYAWSDGTVFKKIPVSTFPICKKVTAMMKANPSIRGDTTGCGDNFCGGMLAYLGDALSKGKTSGNLDLFEGITWCVASGGFTCFVLGGTYIEKRPGEKRRKVEHLRQAYIEQVRSSKL